jgi:hypothetical protein
LESGVGEFFVGGLTMKRALAVLLLAACAAAAAAAQGEKKGGKSEKPRPDLSGTWLRDNDKSDFGNFAQSPLARAKLIYVIDAKDPEIKITRKSALDGQEDSRQVTHYSDGRGETNPAMIGDGEMKSKTKWEGSKLVAKSSTSSQTPNGPLYMETLIKWELSDDGKTLTETISMTRSVNYTAVRSSTFKQVFTRQS